jgi:hypothetical protein
MKSIMKCLICTVTGCVLLIGSLFTMARLVMCDVNRMDVYSVDSLGRITKGKYFIISSNHSRPPIFNLTVCGNAEIMDSSFFDIFVVNASSNSMHVSAPTMPNGPLNVYDGQGYVNECATDTTTLLIEGVLVKVQPADQPPGEVIERLYVRGVFDRHNYGMSVSRWRMISLIESWLE